MGTQTEPTATRAMLALSDLTLHRDLQMRVEEKEEDIARYTEMLLETDPEDESWVPQLDPVAVFKITIMLPGI
jgi:hypothetical protein